MHTFLKVAETGQSPLSMSATGEFGVFGALKHHTKSAIHAAEAQCFTLKANGGKRLDKLKAIYHPMSGTLIFICFCLHGNNRL